jgi:hypothetical protein
MAKYLNLQIPEACHEDWNTMLPDQQGKFCLSCQKKVIDFTSMSDRQLIEFFKNHKGSTCGRFNSDQLERDILIPQKKIPWLRYFFQFTLPAFLLSLKASGQSPSLVKTKAVTVIETKDKQTMGLPVVGDTIIHKSKSVQGVVKDEKGQPIPGASVMIKGTKKGVAADTLGRFAIKDLPMPAVLTISAVGYYLQELKVDTEQEMNSIMLFQQLTGTFGEVVVVGYAIPNRKQRKDQKKEKKELCIKPVTPSLSLYPNPVAPNNPIALKWQGLQAGSYFLEVYSISGALVHTQKLEVESWMTEYVLESKLMAGNYVVTVINHKSGVRLSRQIIITD